VDLGVVMPHACCSSLEKVHSLMCWSLDHESSCTTLVLVPGVVCTRKSKLHSMSEWPEKVCVGRVRSDKLQSCSELSLYQEEYPWPLPSNVSRKRAHQSVNQLDRRTPYARCGMVTTASPTGCAVRHRRRYHRRRRSRAVSKSAYHLFVRAQERTTKRALMIEV